MDNKELMSTARNKALAEAEQACTVEQVAETGIESDSAYNSGVVHCVEAIRSLRFTAPLQSAARDAALEEAARACEEFDMHGMAADIRALKSIATPAPVQQAAPSGTIDTSEFMEFYVAAACDMANREPYNRLISFIHLHTAREVFACQREWDENLAELGRSLCSIGVVGKIDGHAAVRRSSVIEIFERRAAAPAQPAGLSEQDKLMRRGLVDGCGCGCRGGFSLTEAGRLFLEKNND